MILERTSAGLCSSLILSEKLYPHLLEIDRAEQERMDAMLPRMMEVAGVTEELKACDPMRWVGLMNTLKAQAEEIIQDELIYNYFLGTRKAGILLSSGKSRLCSYRFSKFFDRRYSSGDSPNCFLNTAANLL